MKVNVLSVFAAIVVLAGTARAQVKQAGSAAAVATSAARDYYRCVAPKTCTCWAFSEQDKKACTECESWQRKIIAAAMVPVVQSLDTAGYKDAAGTFVSTASHTLYGTKEGPVPISELYKNPERHGYRVVSADSAKAGAFVVYPNIAGMVLNNEKDVVYPSASRDGKLTVIKADQLSKEQAKILVPAKPPL